MISVYFVSPYSSQQSTGSEDDSGCRGSSVGNTHLCAFLSLQALLSKRQVSLTFYKW